MPAVARRGYSLVEVLVGAVVASMLLASAAALLQSGRRYVARHRARLEARRAVAAVAGVLRAELEGVAFRHGDAIAVSDSSVRIRAGRGGGAVCGARPDVLLVDTTTWRAVRAVDPARDEAAVLVPGRAGHPDEDRWLRAAIAAVGSGTCAAGAAAHVFRLDTTGVGPLTVVPPGAPLRVIETVEYRLYKDGAGQRYLGQSARSGGTWSAISPVAGPLAAGGLHIRLMDQAGVVVAAPESAAVVRVAVVGRSARPTATGAGVVFAFDSVVATIQATRP